MPAKQQKKISHRCQPVIQNASRLGLPSAIRFMPGPRRVLFIKKMASPFRRREGLMRWHPCCQFGSCPFVTCAAILISCCSSAVAWTKSSHARTIC